MAKLEEYVLLLLLSIMFLIYTVWLFPTCSIHLDCYLEILGTWEFGNLGVWELRSCNVGMCMLLLLQGSVISIIIIIITIDFISYYYLK